MTEELTEEEALHQGFKVDEFAFLSEMLGPHGLAFDYDDALKGNDGQVPQEQPSVDDGHVGVCHSILVSSLCFDVGDKDTDVAGGSSWVGTPVGIPQGVRCEEYEQLLGGGRAAVAGGDGGDSKGG